jgi:transposase
MLSPKNGAYLAEAMPDARLVIFEDSGHAPFWDEPDRFNDEVESFIARLAYRSDAWRCCPLSSRDWSRSWPRSRSLATWAWGRRWNTVCARALIATGLADRLDLDAPTRDAVYWVSLMAMVGCAADSFELRRLFGDDIALPTTQRAGGPDATRNRGAGADRSRTDDGAGRASPRHQAEAMARPGLEPGHHDLQALARSALVRDFRSIKPNRVR